MTQTSSNSTATGASFGSILGVNIDNGDTPLQCFIFNKGLELSEGPAIVDIPLLLPNPCSFSDVGELFHHDELPFSDGLNYSFADSMIEVGHPPSLLPGKPSQELLSSLRAFGLERRAKVLEMPPYILSLSTGEFKSIGGGGNIVYSQIYSNWFYSLRYLRYRLGKNYINIKFLLSLLIDKDSKGRFLPFKKISLVITNSKRYLQSPFNCGKRDLLLIRIIGKNPLVVINRSCLERFNFSWFSLSRLRNSTYCSYGKICSKVKFSPYIFITKLLKFKAISGFLSLRNLQDIVASIGKTLHCFFKSLPLFFGRLKFAFNCFYYHYTYIISYKKGVSTGQFLPGINSGASLPNIR